MSYLNYLKVQRLASLAGLAVGAILLFSSSAYCQWEHYGGNYSPSGGKGSFMAIIGSYRGYANPNTQSGVQGNKIQPSGDLEIDFRVFKIFSITGVGGASPDNSYTFGGAGLRVDIPGFFFIGADPQDLLHRRRKYPVNTSFHGELSRFGIAAYREAGNLPWQFYAARGGFTVDLMLPHQDALFISLDMSFFNVNGDSYITGACGLGLEL